MTTATGTWQVTIESPLGQQRRLMVIAADRDRFSATISDGQASHAVTGTVDGERLQWTDQVTQPMKLNLQFDVTLAGDTMSGVVRLGIFGKAKFSAMRSPA